MKNDDKNSKPLEEFFQRKVWEHDISYREDDWQELEKKLDAVDAAILSRRWKYLAAAVLALVLGVLAYFTYENNIELNRLSGQLNEQQATRSTGNEGGDQNPNLAENDSQTGIADTVDDTEENDRQGHNKVSGPETSIIKQAKRQGIDASVLEETVVNKETSSLFVAQFVCEACAVSSTVIPTPLQAASLVESLNVPSQTVAVNSNSTGNYSAARGSGFEASVAFVLAPDLSAAGSLSNFDSPGYKLGLTAQVQLSSRLAVSTGLIYSHVNYQARGSAYEPPVGYWPNGVVAQNTFAQCAILDFPLNLKYEVFQFDHSSAFVSAGLSSYIMLSEDYQFEYAYDDPQLAQGWKADTGTRHWFSNMNFSVGYEWELHQKIGLQVEPFIKVPVKEVGWGNVKLFSVGSFVSLTYKIQ